MDRDNIQHSASICYGGEGIVANFAHFEKFYAEQVSGRNLIFLIISHNPGKSISLEIKIRTATSIPCHVFAKCYS